MLELLGEMTVLQWSSKESNESLALVIEYLWIQPIHPHKCKEAYTTYVTSKENGLIEGGNLGSFYRYVNSKLVHKTGMGVLIDNGSYIYDDQT